MRCLVNAIVFHPVESFGIGAAARAAAGKNIQYAPAERGWLTDNGVVAGHEPVNEGWLQVRSSLSAGLSGNFGGVV